MIERVHIVENFQTMGHRVIVVGRQHPGAPPASLQADGSWEAITENSIRHDHPDLGFNLPEGALDAIVAAYRNVAAPHPATERHLDDAIAVRDTLLKLVAASVEASVMPRASYGGTA